MYIHRVIEQDFLQSSETFPAVLVTGPRQTGKTTMLRHLAETDRKYISLDDAKIRMFARTEPEQFLEKYPPPVIIDEIQYAPEILPYIKLSIDEHHENGAFWLTGSQKFSMMKNVGESLAGRVCIMNLPGLSYAEITGKTSEPFTTEPDRLKNRYKTAQPRTLPEIYAAIFRGSFPALIANPRLSREKFYASYVNTYLLRDVREFTRIEDETAFLRFMTAVAARTGRMLIYEDIAKDSGISTTTAKRWTAILIALSVIILIPPYYSNIIKRIVKAPILHFLDTGLCTYLLGWDSPETLENGIMAGNMLETYVCTEIYKSYLAAGMEPPLYFYRDENKREIDLILYRNGTLSPIEVKKTGHPDKKDLTHIRYVREKLTEIPEKTITGAVICPTNDLLPIDSDTYMVPVWLI